jgi:hypothetical protein
MPSQQELLQTLKRLHAACEKRSNIDTASVLLYVVLSDIAFTHHQPVIAASAGLYAAYTAMGVYKDSGRLKEIGKLEAKIKRHLKPETADAFTAEVEALEDELR